MAFQRELISESGLRNDGRTIHQCRKIVCEPGVVSRADGSARFQLVSVHGPHEVKFRREADAKKLIIKAELMNNAFGSAEHKEFSKNDHRAQEICSNIVDIFTNVIICDRFPNSCLTICVQVIQNDGGVHSAAINGTTLALLDAGIPLKDICTSISVGFSPTKQSLVDLTFYERGAGIPEIQMAALRKSKNLVGFLVKKKIRLAEMSRCIRDGLSVLVQIADLMIKVTRDSSLVRSKTLGSVVEGSSAL